MEVLLWHYLISERKKKKRRLAAVVHHLKKQFKSEDECRIKVLGAGCKSCHEMYESVMETASGYGLCADVSYITDMAKIMGYGVMTLPALVIDEKVVSMGKILKQKEIEKLMKEAGLVKG